MSEFTLGGYMQKHERAAAFGGSDGAAYSVAIYVEEEPDFRGRHGRGLPPVRGPLQHGLGQAAHARPEQH